MANRTGDEQPRRVGPPWSIICLVYGGFCVGIPICAWLYWQPDHFNPVGALGVFLIGVTVSILGLWAVRAETGTWWP